MAIQIEKGVPAPEHTGRGHEPKYPWREMEVGDSFVIPDEGGAASFAGTANRRNPGKRFASRKEGNMRRIWRVE